MAALRPPTLAAFVVFLGAAPSRGWPSRVGIAADLSYGVYLYHFPVIQLLIAVGIAGRSVASDIFVLTPLALLITLPLAAASWHLVEAPAQRFARGRGKPAHPTATPALREHSCRHQAARRRTRIARSGQLRPARGGRSDDTCYWVRRVGCSSGQWWSASASGSTDRSNCCCCGSRRCESPPPTMSRSRAWSAGTCGSVWSRPRLRRPSCSRRGTTRGGAVPIAVAGFAYFSLLRTLAIQRGVSAGRGDYPRYARQVNRRSDKARTCSDPAARRGVHCRDLGCSGGHCRLGRGTSSSRQAVGPVQEDAPSSEAADARESLHDVLALTAGTTRPRPSSRPIRSQQPRWPWGPRAPLSRLASARWPWCRGFLLLRSGPGRGCSQVAAAGGDEPTRRRDERRLLSHIAIGSAVTAVFVGVLTRPVVSLAFPAGQAPSACVVWLLALATGALLFALVGQGILLVGRT